MAPSLAHGPAPGDTGNGQRQLQHEERDCPGCGAALRRVAGGRWREGP